MIDDRATDIGFVLGHCYLFQKSDAKEFCKGICFANQFLYVKKPLPTHKHSRIFMHKLA